MFPGFGANRQSLVASPVGIDRTGYCAFFSSRMLVANKPCISDRAHEPIIHRFLIVWRVQTVWVQCKQAYRLCVHDCRDHVMLR